MLSLLLPMSSGINKSRLESGLDLSEKLIVISGLVLAWGCIGEYLWDHKKIHVLPRFLRWPELAFVLMVAISLVCEFVADAGVYICSSRLQILEGATIKELDAKANEAGRKAEGAISNSDSAVAKAAGAREVSQEAHKTSNDALRLARGAHQEADTFEGRLKSAERLANDAVSQIQTAVRQAGEAVSELERMKLPRDLPHPETLRSAVMPFQGTRYNFSVFGDDESGAVLKKLAGILESAKWIREKQAHIRIGITAYQTFGPNDLVEQCSDSGIAVQVEFPGGWEALNALAERKWPSRWATLPDCHVLYAVLCLPAYPS